MNSAVFLPVALPPRNSLTHRCFLLFHSHKHRQKFLLLCRSPQFYPRSVRPARSSRKCHLASLTQVQLTHVEANFGQQSPHQEYTLLLFRLHTQPRSITSKQTKRATWLRLGVHAGHSVSSSFRVEPRLLASNLYLRVQPGRRCSQVGFSFAYLSSIAPFRK